MGNGEDHDDRLPSAGWSASVPAVGGEEVERMREAAAPESPAPDLGDETEAFLRGYEASGLDKEVESVEFDLQLESAVSDVGAVPGSPAESSLSGDAPPNSPVSLGTLMESGSGTGDSSDELIDALGGAPEEDTWRDQGDTLVSTAREGQEEMTEPLAEGNWGRASTDSGVAARSDELDSRHEQPTLDGEDFYASSNLPALSGEADLRDAERDSSSRSDSESLSNSDSGGPVFAEASPGDEYGDYSGVGERAQESLEAEPAEAPKVFDAANSGESGVVDVAGSDEYPVAGPALTGSFDITVSSEYQSVETVDSGDYEEIGPSTSGDFAAADLSLSADFEFVASEDSAESDRVDLSMSGDLAPAALTFASGRDAVPFISADFAVLGEFGEPSSDYTEVDRESSEPLEDASDEIEDKPVQNLSGSHDGPFVDPHARPESLSGAVEYFSEAYEVAREEGRLVAVDVNLSTSEMRRSVETPFGVESLPPEVTVPKVEGGLPEGEFHWANQFDLFRDEALKLARAKRWRRLAATTAHACVHAPYSRGGTRTAMLLDLARIYRDRLKDSDLAEEAFRAAALAEPENAEAIAFLSERFEERGDFRAMYELYHHAVESTWDPDDRLAWTQRAAQIANDRLRDLSLATAAWEQLWALGDAGEQTARELTRAYRLANNWPALAKFLGEAVEQEKGPARTVLMRELAELELSGNNDPKRAAAILREIGKENPEDPLIIPQLARIHSATENWDALEDLGTEELTSLSANDLVERRHLVAGVLWDAGRLAQAASIYIALIAENPEDAVARERYHLHLRDAGEYDTLYASLLGRADAESSDEARAQLLADAAEVARVHLGAGAEAIDLLERRLELISDDTDSLNKLAGLYESTGDDDGLARSLHGLRELETNPENRLGILRRLAIHTTASDEEAAQECWTEILALDANDMDAREQLMLLHRGRGNFAALDEALMRQIALTQSDEHALRLSRMAAENLDANFEDADRSIDAWRRVLDYAPGDLDALQALTAHFHAAGDQAQEIAVLENRILVAEDIEVRTDLSLQVAALWAESEEPRAAAAAYERVLHWDPRNRAALDGILDVYTAGERPDLALDALDQAVGGCDDNEDRIALLQRSLELVEESDHAGRFSRLRRIHLLDRSDDSVVEELAETAEAGELWAGLAAVLENLIAELPAGERRDARRGELVELLAAHLDRADRKYAVLQASLLSSTASEALLEQLSTLAEETGRDEDYLALLGARTVVGFDAAARRTTISERARLLETRVEDPERAFWELRRLIELDPSDWSPLEELGRLAAEHSLWAQLVDVLIELGDSSTGLLERLDVAAQIETIASEKLEDASLAFRMTVRRFRLQRADEGTHAALLESAEELDEWAWVLPVVEAARLADLSTETADSAADVGALYAEQTEELERAFGLFKLAFAADPDSETLPNKLSELLGETERYADYAASLRQAAATTGDEERAVDLLRRTAAVYEEHLDRPEDAVDVHRRLLELRDDELGSLEVMIATHRDREQWHDLRDRLERWIEIGGDDDLKIERLVEVAELSEQHLGDPHYALEVYGKVLEADADHAVARERIEDIVQRLDDPRLRLAFLRVEFARAEEGEQAQIELSIADLQLNRLQDSDGAIETLEALVERAGIDSDGFEPLVSLLKETGANRRRIQLFLEKADATDDAQGKVDTLRTALDESIRCDDLSDEERERILRALLEQQPDDVMLHRQYAQLLRMAERFEELCEVLGETGGMLDDEVERLEVNKERARLLFANLDRTSEAVTVWQQIIEADPEDEATLLALAMASLRDGQIEDYVTRRRQHAAALPPEEASLVLCHLAEVADEHELGPNKVADFYREARRTHSSCETAKLALKGIGRRKKQLRPEAALLPMEGESAMPWFERAERLGGFGDEALNTDLGRATNWYRRAVATNPNDVAAWDKLAEAYDRADDRELAYRARTHALEAVRRNSPLSVATVDDEATRLLAIAGASQAVGAVDEYERIIRRVHSIAPTHGPTAVAVSDVMIAAGESADAYYLLDSLLSRHAVRIPSELLADVYFARGCTERDSGKTEAAISDFARALDERPLFPSALREFAILQAESGHSRSAIEHLIRALVVEEKPLERASLLHELGTFWEDGLEQLDEAGACYELARAEGLSSRSLMLRVFKHFQRTGQLQQGLDVVDTLLKSASDADELATLWLARGEIYAEHEGREEDAVEAFDMALSYDPDLNEARSALATVLERREDWDQLLQILEAIAESDAGSAAQRADAFLRMAHIAAEQLDDRGRAEEYLHASNDAERTIEALTMLADLMVDTASGSDEHRALLGELAAMGPPWFKHCIALGETALGDQDRYAWCLLSPALMVRSSDDQLKSQLRDMRREYERPPLLVPEADQQGELWVDGCSALSEILAEVDSELSVARHKLKSLGDEVTDVSVHSNIGRTFAQFATHRGLGGCTLHRIAESSRPVTIVNRENGEPAVVIRADVFQQLARAEIGFILAYGTELARPGNRVFASGAGAEQVDVIEALWDAVGFRDAESDPAVELSLRIREAFDEETLDGWSDSLTALGEFAPEAAAETFADALAKRALYLGLIAGADLFQAVRLLVRMEGSQERPGVFDTNEAFDEYLGESDQLRSLVEFAASRTFAKLLLNSFEV